MSFRNRIYGGRILTCIAATFVAGTLMLSGCSNTNDTDNENIQSSDKNENNSGNKDNSSNNTNKDTTNNISESEVSSLDTKDMFSKKDKDIEYDEKNAVIIKLSDDITSSDNSVKIEKNIITLSKADTYIIKGEAKDAQVVVDAGDEDKVWIVLDGADITCKNSAPIYVKNADKVFVTLAKDSKNTLRTSSEFINEDDTNIDGVVFSKKDITFNGAGTLYIETSNGNGIVSKKDIAVTGGTYNISASAQGISGKNSVRIADGIFDITAGKDGIHGDNEEDSSKGYVYIAGGSFDIEATKQGVSATGELLIDDGTIGISKSYEGFEGGMITINGGDITIEASDDGMNVNKSTGLYINGGNININASGDGIDSNGLFNMTGGTVYLSGPTENMNGPIDYETTAKITGGVIVAAGSSGMAMNFGSDSTQCSMLVKIDKSVSGEVILKDIDGKELIRYTPQKVYTSVVISTPDIEVGKTYTVLTGDIETEVTMDVIIYGEGMSGFGGHGGFGGQDGDFQGKPSDGNIPNKPSDGKFPNKSSDGKFPEMPSDGKFPDNPSDENFPDNPSDEEV